MQVVIDPRIEQDAEALERVRFANTYLEYRLGEFRDRVEAKWSTPSDPSDQLELTLRFTDDVPVQASNRFSTNALTIDRYPGPRLRRTVNHLFGRRLDVHVSNVKRMLRELDREPATTGA